MPHILKSTGFIFTDQPQTSAIKKIWPMIECFSRLKKCMKSSPHLLLPIQCWRYYYYWEQCKHINNSISCAVLSSVPTVIISPEMQSSCLNISLANITYPPLFSFFWVSFDVTQNPLKKEAEIKEPHAHISVGKTGHLTKLYAERELSYQ